MLIIHIIFAIGALTLAFVNFNKLSSKLFYYTKISVIATVISGLALILSSQASFAHVCVSGAAFISAVSILMLSTKNKLAKQSIRK